MSDTAVVAPEEFIRDWLGTPHVYNGRDKAGIDCYGLVWLYYRDVLGRDIPDWHCVDTSRLWVSRFMEARVREFLDVIARPEDNCIALVKRKAIANHIGVYYKGGIFHCLESSKVVYQPTWVAETVFGSLKYGVVRDEFAGGTW